MLAKATYGTEGSASAPLVYMLMDPQCMYSIRAFQALQPYVQAGQIQLAIIPLSVLDYEDNGQSTRSALALLSDAPRSDCRGLAVGAAKTTRPVRLRRRVWPTTWLSPKRSASRAPRCSGGKAPMVRQAISTVCRRMSPASSPV